MVGGKVREVSTGQSTQSLVDFDKESELLVMNSGYLQGLGGFSCGC